MLENAADWVSEPQANIAHSKRISAGAPQRPVHAVLGAFCLSQFTHKRTLPKNGNQMKNTTKPNLFSCQREHQGLHIRHEYPPPSARRKASAVLRSCGNALAELLGEPDEKSFGAADVAEPIRVLVLNHFADELRAALA